MCSCIACHRRISASCASLPRTSRLAPRHDGQADWQPHARRCIRLNRSGISPRRSVGSGGNGFCPVRRIGGNLQRARRSRLQRTPFDQRISPAPQRGNMHVDPVVPPVKAGGVIPERLFLLWHQCVRKLLDIVGDEIVFIMKNERFEQFNQLFHSFQTALGLRKRRASSKATAP